MGWCEWWVNHRGYQPSKPRNYRSCAKLRPRRNQRCHRCCCRGTKKMEAVPSKGKSLNSKIFLWSYLRSSGRFGKDHYLRARQIHDWSNRWNYLFGFLYWMVCRRSKAYLWWCDTRPSSRQENHSYQATHWGCSLYNTVEFSFSNVGKKNRTGTCNRLFIGMQTSKTNSFFSTGSCLFSRTGRLAQGIIERTNR